MVQRLLVRRLRSSTIAIAVAIAALSPVEARSQGRAQCPELDNPVPRLNPAEETETRQIAREIGSYTETHDIESASKFATNKVYAGGGLAERGRINRRAIGRPAVEESDYRRRLLRARGQG